jgi:hypothetical protein
MQLITYSIYLVLGTVVDELNSSRNGAASNGILDDLVSVVVGGSGE